MIFKSVRRKSLNTVRKLETPKACELFYRRYNSYKDLPRFWEIAYSIEMNLGRGYGLLKSIKLARKVSWVKRLNI